MDSEFTAPGMIRGGPASFRWGEMGEIGRPVDYFGLKNAVLKGPHDRCLKGSCGGQQAVALVEECQAAIQALMHLDTGMGVADSFFGW